MNYEEEIAVLRKAVKELRVQRDDARTLNRNLLAQLARAERARAAAERRAAARVGISAD